MNRPHRSMDTSRLAKMGKATAVSATRRGLDAVAAGAGTVLGYAGRLRRSLGRRRTAYWLAAAPLVACCCAGAVLTATAIMFFGEEERRLEAGGPVAAVCVLPIAEEVSLDSEQWHHAELIIDVGRRLAAPPRAWVIAIATALQESSLRNLPHLGADNDHDSVGLFQQRPSQGWGTAEQLQEPEYATTVFYQRLLALAGWQELALTQAAQAVQRSAYPDAYARHEPLAATLVAVLTGGTAGAAHHDDPRCAEWHEVSAAGWTLPAPGLVWSGFRTANRPEHYGVDIGAARGTVIRAAADGRVIVVACNATLHGQPYSCDVDGSPAVAGCGWYTDILHAGNVVTRYCHLLRRPEAQVGQQVIAGQPIGEVGSSGRSSGPHLHFEVELRGAQRQGTQVVQVRRQVDPVAFLAERGVALECPGSVADCRPVHGDRVR